MNIYVILTCCICRRDKNRLQLECFDVGTNFKHEIIRCVNDVAKSVGDHLGRQYNIQFHDSMAFGAVIIVPSGTSDKMLSFQHFHRDSESVDRVANVLLACDDNNFTVDFLSSLNSIKRISMGAGEGVLFHNHVHRGTNTRGVRLHIRYELSRRCHLAEVSA